MKYFNYLMSLEDIKKTYRKLALKLYSNMGDSDVDMLELTNELNMVFPVAHRRENTCSNETSYSFKAKVYTENGWVDAKYNPKLSRKDVAKIVKGYIKYIYPTYRFSVTIAGSCITISVALMESPVEITNYELVKEDLISLHNYETMFYIPSIKKHVRGCDVLKEENFAYFDELVKSNLDIIQNKGGLSIYKSELDEIKYLNPVIIEVFKDLTVLLENYQYEDIDLMTDYSNVNFYFEFKIGKQGKPAKVVKRTSRLNSKEKIKGAKLLKA